MRSSDNRVMFQKELPEKLLVKKEKSLVTTALPLMKNVLTPLAKGVLVPSGLTTAARQQQTHPFKRKLNLWIGSDSISIFK